MAYMDVLECKPPQRIGDKEYMDPDGWTQGGNMAIELNGFLAEGINRHDHNGEIRMLTFRCPSGRKHTHSIPTSDVNAFKYGKGSPFEDIEVWHRVFQNGKLVIMPSIDGSKRIDGTTIVPCGFHDFYIFNLVPKEEVFFG